MILPPVAVLGALAVLALILDYPRASCGRALALSQGDELSVQGLSLLRRAADAGAPECQNALGTRHWYGAGVAEDDAAAAAWFGRAARLGHVAAQRNLGFAYFRGLGVARDPVQAEYWLRRAADQGDDIADYRLGEMLAPRDPAEAARRYTRAALRGYGPAQRELGDLYRLGRGVRQDQALAESWLRKASAGDDVEARFLLAVVLRGEDRRNPNCGEAGQLMQEAAERGFVQAQRELGFMVLNGWCVPWNAKKGVSWLRGAAERNDDIAQYLLAQSLRTGLGTAVNVAEANQWLKRAAAQGYEPAIQALAELATAPRPAAKPVPKPQPRPRKAPGKSK